jgi:gliding motility-associated protein GldM
MAHGKETPRQKMIGMMYLVLTALLALNVQKEVLNAFITVDEGITKMNENYYDKNSKMYADFDQAVIEKPKKAKKWRDVAYEVKKQSNEIFETIQELKIEIVKTADGPDAEAIKGKEVFPDKVKSTDNMEVPGRIMIVSGKAAQLKVKIEKFRNYLLDQVDPKAEGIRKSILKSLNTDPGELKDGIRESWEQLHFEHLPLLGVTTILSGLQSNVRNGESDMIRYLYSMIDKGTFKFTNLEATVIHNSNYVIQGNDYQARIFLAAFDTVQKPTIYIGPVDSSKNEDGTGGYSYKMRAGYKYDTIPVKNGKGIYTRKGTTVGDNKWGGLIKLKAPEGGTDILKPFKDEYQVAEPMLVVSPTKMNVFYLGVDNPVEISAPGVGNDKIFPSISNGSISKDGKGYIVRPGKAGPIQVSVMVEIEKVKRLMGTKDFRVRILPNPTAKVGGFSIAANIDKNLLLAQTGVVAELEGTDFDAPFKVIEFSVSTIVGGFSSDKISKTNKFTSEQMGLIKQASKNQKVYIEGIKAVGPDGTTRQLGSISLTIK